MDEVRNHLEPERQIAQETENLHSREIDLCVECLEHLTKGFNEIGGSFAWEEPRATILLLATRGYNSLRWAWEMLRKGYYSQANTLSRTAWECWFHGLYLMLHPDKLEDWRSPANRPDLTRMRNRVVED